MKVARLEHLHADAGKGVLDFLKLTTDDGGVGWSEYNETFGGAGVTAAIDGLAPLVIGRDPRAREAIVTTLYAVRRQAPGGVIQQAIAAIENALLDAHARALGVPVYELLGGPQRQRLRLYWSHCGYFRLFAARQMQIPPLRNLSDVVAQGKEVVAKGFTALKTNIFLFDEGAPHAHMPGFARADSEVPGLNAERRVIGALRDQLAAFREGVRQPLFWLIGLVAVGTFKKFFGWELREELPGLGQIYIAFDADWRTNDKVQYHFGRLNEALAKAGLIAKRLEWPLEQGKGLDDYLINRRLSD